jgi:hypothetical protein
MKQVGKIFDFFIRIPMLFIISIYKLYIVYMIVKNTEINDLDIDNEDELYELINKYVDTFYKENLYNLKYISIMFYMFLFFLIKKI